MEECHNIRTMSYTPKQQIPLFKVFMSSTIMNPLKEVLFSGYVTQGPKVDEFEAKLSQFLNHPYVATVNSATSALHLALDLAGVTTGDEVISTPMTCTATNWPILAHGAKIVWADINPTTGNIDPKSIQQNITKKTKAIMIVNWGGYPCDIDEIKKIAPGIPVIEDAAHAFGAIYKGRMVGQTANYTCFSFQAIKHLTTVDGGALTVQNESDHERAILLRYFGIDRRKRSKDYRIEKDVYTWGYKFHMNDVAATIGLQNFNHVEHILKTHRNNAEFYKKELRGLRKINLLSEEEGYVSSYWLFTMLVDNPEKFSDFMKERNVMASQVHRRNDNHPVTKPFLKSLPGVDEFTRHMVCIPVGWWVSKKDREYIITTVKSYDVQA